MLSAIIADDEKYIISLIKNLADWDGLGISLIGEVQDGIDALNLVSSLKPDILLTDIRMPGIDGLELSRRSKELNEDISIVIISGHKQFDYAYGALKYGVEDFLIKPINRRELNEVLAQICQKRSVSHNKAGRLHDLERRIQDGEATIWKLLIEEGLKGKYETDLTADTRMKPADPQGRLFCCLSVKFDFQRSADTNYKTILEHANGLLTNFFSSKDIGTALSSSGDLIVCMLAMKSGDEESIFRLAGNCLDELHLRLDIFPDLVFSIGTSRCYMNVDRTPRAVMEAVEAVKCKAIMGAGTVISALRIGLELVSVSLPEQQSFSLAAIMEAYSDQAVREWLAAVFHSGSDYYLAKPWEAIALSEAAFDEFRLKADQAGMHVAGEDWSSFAAELSNASTFDLILSALEKGIRRIVLANYEERLNRETLPIRLAKEYIQEHLGKQVSLDEIAASVSLSPAYFSSLFKKSTGTNVSDYIMDQRIAEAKHLLRTSTLNISEIAGRVGYTDPKHFSKLFTKKTTVQPQQYRKLYSR